MFAIFSVIRLRTAYERKGWPAPAAADSPQWSSQMRPMFAAVVCSALLTSGLGVSISQAQPGAGAVAVQGLVATIAAVDAASRQVLLRVAEGDLITVVAEPEVQNFDQLRVGDRIEIEYQEAVVLELARPQDGRPPVETTANVERAPRGERPAGVLQRAMRARVRIEALDPASGRVTFRRPEGALRTVTAVDPNARDFLRELRVGDEVDVTYTEALAVRVSPK